MTAPQSPLHPTTPDKNPKEIHEKIHDEYHDKKLGFLLFSALWFALIGCPFPSHQQKMAQFLENAYYQGDHQLLLMAFRGSGKSTLVALFCAWLLYINPQYRILVLSAEQHLATLMVNMVRGIFTRHPLLLPLVPKNPTPQNPIKWAKDEFTINRPHQWRDPSMMGRGIDGNITGTHADIIICDDVEVPNNSYSHHQRTALRQKLVEVDFVLSSPHNQTNSGPAGMILYIGTPHHHDTIYNDKGFLAGFTSYRLPLLDDDNRSQWPEKFNDNRIQNLRQKHGRHGFLSQMMLTIPASDQNILSPQAIMEYHGRVERSENNHIASWWLMGMAGDHPIKRRITAIGCFWDPAYGSSQKKNAQSDNSVVAVMGKDEEGRYYILGLYYLNQILSKDKTPSDLSPARRQVKEVINIMDQHHARGITIENNGLGKFLPGLLKEEMRQQKKNLIIHEISQRQHKQARIFEVFDVLLPARALYADQAIRLTPFYQEMAQFRLQDKNTPDDGLDAVAGCVKSKFYRPASIF